MTERRGETNRQRQKVEQAREDVSKRVNDISEVPRDAVLLPHKRGSETQHNTKQTVTLSSAVMYCWDPVNMATSKDTSW